MATTHLERPSDEKHSTLVSPLCKCQERSKVVQWTKARELGGDRGWKLVYLPSTMQSVTRTDDCKLARAPRVKEGNEGHKTAHAQERDATIASRSLCGWGRAGCTLLISARLSPSSSLYLLAVPDNPE